MSLLGSGGRTASCCPPAVTGPARSSCALTWALQQQAGPQRLAIGQEAVGLVQVSLADREHFDDHAAFLSSSATQNSQRPQCWLKSPALAWRQTSPAAR